MERILVAGDTDLCRSVVGCRFEYGSASTKTFDYENPDRVVLNTRVSD